MRFVFALADLVTGSQAVQYQVEGRTVIFSVQQGLPRQQQLRHLGLNLTMVAAWEWTAPEAMGSGMSEIHIYEDSSVLDSPVETAMSTGQLHYRLRPGMSDQEVMDALSHAVNDAYTHGWRHAAGLRKAAG